MATEKEKRVTMKNRSQKMDSNKSIVINSKKAIAKLKISTPKQRISLCLFAHKGMNRCTLQ